MTHAYKTGIELRETLREGACLRTAVSEVTIYTEYLEDGYPGWHPAPHSFEGMLRLFIYREITGDSYRTLETYQELADPFELEHVPDESVLSRTWRNRFTDGVREYVTVAAHFVVKEIHDHGPAISAVRPKEDVIESDDDSPSDDEEDSRAFPMNKSTGRRVLLMTMASTLDERRTLPTRTHSSSSYRRSWVW